MAEIQRADDRRRRLAIVVLIVVLIGGVALWMVAEEWKAEVRSLPVDAAKQSLSIVFSLCMGIMTVCVCLAGWHCWRTGGQVRHAMRFPPHTSVVRDTTVLTGQAAVSRGRLLQVSGVILMLCALGLAVMSWSVLKMIHDVPG
ncbi:MAG: hypothetical protein A4E19_02995 [Nitrospira sp. SG-bin1]|nr:MAG: hypothetical protein A4E19_02995 [Nitrospira sp. SG-bin1]